MPAVAFGPVTGIAVRGRTEHAGPRDNNHPGDWVIRVVNDSPRAEAEHLLGVKKP
jgi:hypothetical protein